jgi:hypothetical protein
MSEPFLGAEAGFRSLFALLRQFRAPLALLAVFGLYSGVVGLALLHDDAPVIFEINSQSALTVFVPGTSHYRPSSYFLWLLTRDVFGWYDASILYWINLALHILNTTLVMRVAGVLRARRFGALRGHDVAAGLVFGFFPLSYQVLTWASAMVHATLLAYTLGAALCLFEFMRARRKRFLVGGVLLLVLAMTSHQYGVIAPVIVAMILTFAVRSSIRLRLAAGAALAVVAIAYAGWLSTITTLSRPISLAAQNPIGVFGNGSTQFVAQAVAFPFSPVLVALGFREPNIHVATALYASFFLTVAVVGAGVLRAGLVSRFTFALLWLVLTCAPLLLVLDSAYIRVGSRLFYVASLGIALLWTCVTARARFGKFVLNVLLFAVCAWSAWFITQRVDAARAISSQIKRIAADMRASPPSQPFVIVNHPRWLITTRSMLPAGDAAVLVLADEYSEPWLHYWANSSVIRDVRLIRISDAPRTQIDVDGTIASVSGALTGRDEINSLLRAGGALYAFDIESNRLVLRDYGSLAHLDSAYVARFALEPGTARLAGTAATTCDMRVTVQLEWEGVEDIDEAIGVFVHVYDASNRRLAAQDADLIGGWVSLEQLEQGVSVVESRYLTFADRPEDPASVRVGVYYKSNGQTKRAFRSDGSEWPNNEVVIPIDAAQAQCRY